MSCHFNIHVVLGLGYIVEGFHNASHGSNRLILGDHREEIMIAFLLIFGLTFLVGGFVGKLTHPCSVLAEALMILGGLLLVLFLISTTTITCTM